MEKALLIKCGLWQSVFGLYIHGRAGLPRRKAPRNDKV
jgi:hypothetical protein